MLTALQTRPAIFAFLVVLAACQDAGAPRALGTEVAHPGIISPSPIWQVSYAGSEWYHRARAWAVNDSNVVVGSVQLGVGSESTKGFRASNGAVQLLLLGNGRISHVARGINNAGEIVGWTTGGGAFNDNAPWWGDTAFYRSAAAVTTTLPMSPGANKSGAYDINDAGWIAGFDVGDPSPLLWIRGNLGHFIAYDLGGPLSDAVAVNNSGLVAGTSWSGYGAVRLGLNGWDDLSDGGYCASDINDSNVLVGIGPDSSIVTFQAFGIIPQGITATSSNCYGDAPRISNRGRIAGTRRRLGAFTKMYDVVETLPLPSEASFAYANGINTCGTISGSVVSRTTGKQRPVIWRRMVAGVQVCD